MKKVDEKTEGNEKEEVEEEIAAGTDALHAPIEEQMLRDESGRLASAREELCSVTMLSNNEVMKELTTELIDIRSIGDQPGKASALKMVYASLTKGTTALRVAAMLAGEKLGVGEEIRSEFRYSLPAVYEAIEKRLPDIASVAGRWTGEMREIASTFEGAGLPPAFHEGAEAIFDQLSRTPISGESRDEAAQGDRSMEQLLEIYLKALDDG